MLPLDLYLTLEKRRKEKREAAANGEEELSDLTCILNTTWSSLRETAMSDEY